MPRKKKTEALQLVQKRPKGRPKFLNERKKICFNVDMAVYDEVEKTIESVGISKQAFYEQALKLIVQMHQEQRQRKGS